MPFVAAVISGISERLPALRRAAQATVLVQQAHHHDDAHEIGRDPYYLVTNSSE